MELRQNRVGVKPGGVPYIILEAELDQFSGRTAMSERPLPVITVTSNKGDGSEGGIVQPSSKPGPVHDCSSEPAGTVGVI
jgi:hypothetical protein